MTSHEEKDDDAAAAAAVASPNKLHLEPEAYYGDSDDDGEFRAEVHQDFRVDASFTNSKQLKKETDTGGKEERKKGGSGAQNLKSTILISGVVVAVIGAIFAIVKKMKEA